MAECCGCIQTHNNLNTYSVEYNLASNTLTGEYTPTGVIKIVSALPNYRNGYCNPALAYTPTPDLRAWATHVQNPVGGRFPITETPFSLVTLGAQELAALQAQCNYILILGSGNGICSCSGGVE
jgi:hypothetical protein